MSRQRDYEWETEILTTPRLLRLGAGYAESTLGARWPEWEKAILAIYAEPVPIWDPHPDVLLGAVVTYAKNVIGGRWPEMEPMLLDATTKVVWGNEDFAADYAEGVLHGDWLELEKIILAGECSPAFSVDYAHRVKKTRWPAMEPVLLAYPPNEYLYDALVKYSTEVIGGQWDLAENIILAQPPDEVTAWAVYLYSRDVVGGRWPMGEPTLQACTYAMLKYADDVLKSRLPDHLHNAMVLGDPDDNVREYIGKYGKPRA